MIVAVLLLACRPDPGRPDYPKREPWVETGEDFWGDPLLDGEERLAYGVFYEGEATEEVLLDDVVNHFYIYSGTFTVTVTDDRWEGYVADELTNQGVGWWGGGVHWDVAQDVSGWELLHVAAKSADDEGWTIGLNGGGVEVSLAVADYGFVADDQWHVVEIPLADFAAAGADLTSVTVGLLLLGTGGAAGDAVSIDGLYLTRGRP